MSQAWPKVPIKTVYRGLFDGPHATPPVADEGPVFLGIGNVTEDGHLDLTDVRHISEDDYPKWTKRVTPQCGDIVFTYEATLNRYAIVPEGFRGCLGRRMALIRPDPDKVDTRFLHYTFFGQEWRATIEANRLAGATVDRIPLTHFPEFPIRLPPLANQRKIAAILSAYDDLIANNSRQVRVMEEMARALYREWFVEYRFPGHEVTEFTEDEQGRRPRDWEWVTVGDRVELLYGRALKAEDRMPGPYPVYGSGGVVGHHSLPLSDGPGIIVGRKGNVGAVYWSYDAFFPIDTVYYVRSELPMHYLYFNLQDQNFINNDAAVPGLNRNQAYSLPLLVPDEQILTKFTAFIEDLFQQLNNLRQRNANLRRTRDVLLPRLVSGELDVSHLETV